MEETVKSNKILRKFIAKSKTKKWGSQSITFAELASVVEEVCKEIDITRGIAITAENDAAWGNYQPDAMGN